MFTRERDETRPSHSHTRRRSRRSRLMPFVVLPSGSGRPQEWMRSCCTASAASRHGVAHRGLRLGVVAVLGGAARCRRAARTESALRTAWPGGPWRGAKPHRQPHRSTSVPALELSMGPRLVLPCLLSCPHYRRQPRAAQGVAASRPGPDEPVNRAVTARSASADSRFGGRCMCERGAPWRAGLQPLEPRSPT